MARTVEYQNQVWEQSVIGVISNTLLMRCAWQLNDNVFYGDIQITGDLRILSCGKQQYQMHPIEFATLQGCLVDYMHGGVITTTSTGADGTAKAFIMWKDGVFSNG